MPGIYHGPDPKYTPEEWKKQQKEAREWRQQEAREQQNRPPERPTQPVRHTAEYYQNRGFFRKLFGG